MKRRLTGRILAGALVGWCLLADVLPAAEGDAAVLRRRLAQFDREASAGDLDALMGLFAEDAVAFGSGQAPLVGKASIRAFWKGILEEFTAQAVHEVGEITSIGDVVVLQGDARGSFVSKTGGKAVPIDNWFLHLYRRSANGSLLLWRGSFGPNPPAAQSR